MVRSEQEQTLCTLALNPITFQIQGKYERTKIDDQAIKQENKLITMGRNIEKKIWHEWGPLARQWTRDEASIAWVTKDK